MSAEHRSGRLGEKELGRELWSQETQSYVQSVELLTQEGTKYSQWLSPTKGQRGRQRGKNLGPARLGTYSLEPQSKALLLLLLYYDPGLPMGLRVPFGRNSCNPPGHFVSLAISHLVALKERDPLTQWDESL